jgi:DNA-binding MurR/RpiR family transcriptional regulator
VYETLKSAEKRAADYMLQNPSVIAASTITESAAYTHCSEATLVRLARKLGFNGYPELKSSITEDHQDIGFGILYEEISIEDAPLAVAEKVFRTSVQSLMDTFSLIDEKQYLNALEHLMKAGRIFLAGVGDAYTVAYTGFLKFTRIGLNAYCSQDFDIQLIEASRLKANDVLFIISHTGKTHSLYEVAKLAKRHEANVITITNFPTSPIAKLSDVVLLTAAFVPDNFGEIMTKRIPELCILETLYINVLMRGGKNVSKSLSDSNSAIKANKM